MHAEKSLIDEPLAERFQLLKRLNQLSPYQGLEVPLERRMAIALNTLPTQHRQAAAAMFASTLYITKPMMDDAWQCLWHALQNRMGHPLNLDDLLILELDGDGLLDDFFRTNRLAGRIPSDHPFRGANNLIDVLMQVESGDLYPELKQALVAALKKPYWVLLADQSLSGTSVVQELNRLRKIQRLSPFGRVSILPLIQLATEQATFKLEEKGWDYLAAIQVPLNCALNHESFDTVDDLALKQKMKALCAWFAKNHVLPTNTRLAQKSKKKQDADIAAFGFGKLGWNLVTYKNAPNNALPILWFQSPEQPYQPPFARVESRLGPSWKGRKHWLSRFKGNMDLKAKMRQRLL